MALSPCNRRAAILATHWRKYSSGLPNVSAIRNRCQSDQELVEQTAIKPGIQRIGMADLLVMPHLADQSMALHSRTPR